MRKLTVKLKSGVPSNWGKVYLYIEDNAGDTRISGIPCKKLGEIKGDKSGVYKIDNGNLKLFAIPENQGQNFDYTPFRLPVGEDDITLFGDYKPETGGANSLVFGIEKVTSTQKSDDNKKMKPLTIVLVVISAMLIGVLLGYTVGSSIISAVKAKEKEFSKGEFHITLTGKFVQDDHFGYETAFASKDVAIYVSREDFSETDGIATFTEKEYLTARLKIKGFMDIAIHTDVDLYFFHYTEVGSTSGKEYSHYLYAYKSDEAFWTVDFVVESNKTSKYLDRISGWAKSVHFE